mgnify:CR=1 FL=1
MRKEDLLPYNSVIQICKDDEHECYYNAEEQAWRDNQYEMQMQ